MEISKSAARGKKFLVTPEQSLALQTYEYFKGGPDRQALLEEFQNGDSLELELDYPRLSSQSVDHHVANLDRLVYAKDGDGYDATTEFRLAEAYFLKQAARLNDASEVSQRQVDHFQEMNEQLYGAPDPELTAQMLSRLWQDIFAHRSPANEELIDDLQNGFTFTNQSGDQLYVPPLPSVESYHEDLPTLDSEIHEWLENYLLNELAPAYQVFLDYVNEAGKDSGEHLFLPEEVAILFEKAAAALGIEIDVIKDEIGTNLSWSSVDRAVHVGMQRKPIKGAKDLLGLFAHEVYVHGQRSLNGAMLESKPLENGLFTVADFDEGEDPSYLGFEEGLATVVQKVVSGKENIWNIASMGNYLNIALASMGWTPRQVFEVMSRVRMIMRSEEAPELSEDIEESAKKDALAQVVRVFRATPADKTYSTSEGVTLHYAKDLAYAAGKAKAVSFLNSMRGDSSQIKTLKWKKLLVGHYDPTNHYHRELVESCLTSN